MRLERQAAVAIGAAALLSCGSAWAHGVFGEDVSIWTATQHLFTSPLSLAALIGLAVAIFGIREPASFVASALAASAAVLATVFLPQIPPVAAPAAVVVIGLSAAAGWNFSAGPACALAVLAGMAAGAAADLQAGTLAGPGRHGADCHVLAAGNRQQHEAKRPPAGRAAHCAAGAGFMGGRHGLAAKRAGHAGKARLTPPDGSAKFLMKNAFSACPV